MGGIAPLFASVKSAPFIANCTAPHQTNPLSGEIHTQSGWRKRCRVAAFATAQGCHARVETYAAHHSQDDSDILQLVERNNNETKHECTNNVDTAELAVSQPDCLQ